MSRSIHSTTVTLEQAYSRIQADLARVEALLRQELRGERHEVARLCEHLMKFRGKMLRPAILLLGAQATGAIRAIHVGLAAVVEMFHLGTLIHDDVLDEATVRRRVATINVLRGNEAAVILGDWLMSHAYHLCTKQGSEWASLQIADTAHRVCEGELMQLARRGDLDLDEQDYLQIITLKTASLTALAARLGAHFNRASAEDGRLDEAERACQAYGQALGMAFQIADDVLDIAGENRLAGKTLGSDLAKGKATLPLIHFLATVEASEAQRVRVLLADPTDNHVRQARQMLRANGCIGSAQALARQYAETAKAAIQSLPGGEARDAMGVLADFVVVRSR